MTSSSSRKRTGFFDLSAELRNRIYAAALTSGDDETALHVAFWKATSTRDQDARPGLHGLGLSPNILATCKQINEEATPVLYGNRIKCHIYNPWNFFGRIKHSIQHLRHLDLTLDVDTTKHPLTLPAAKSLLSVTISTTIYDWPLHPRVFRYALKLVHVVQANRMREAMACGVRDCIILQVKSELFFHDRQYQACRKREALLYSMLEDKMGIAKKSDETFAKNSPS